MPNLDRWSLQIRLPHNRTIHYHEGISHPELTEALAEMADGTEYRYTSVRSRYITRFRNVDLSERSPVNNRQYATFGWKTAATGVRNPTDETILEAVKHTLQESELALAYDTSDYGDGGWIASAEPLGEYEAHAIASESVTRYRRNDGWYLTPRRTFDLAVDDGRLLVVTSGNLLDLADFGSYQDDIARDLNPAEKRQLANRAWIHLQGQAN